MGHRIESKDIAAFLDEKLIGKNILITKVVPLNDLKNNSFAFSKSNNITVDKEALIIVPKGTIIENTKISYICVDNPRLSFAKVLDKFFTKKMVEGIHSSTIIENNCKISENVSIGLNCIIGNNVKIGQGTIINNNVVIYDNTKIGENCYIKSGSIIGEDGFGFDFDENEIPVRIPHIGNVQIGNNVEVGSLSIVARATLSSTIIYDNVKIDDHTIVAHNVIIGKNTIITGHCAIGGSVQIGENSWIGSNSSIIQKVKIGNKVTIGIGSLITSNIKDNSIYSEIPTMNIEKASKYKVFMHKMLKSN